MRTSISLILLFLSGVVSAQSSIVFKIQQKPDLVYITEIKTTMIGEMWFDADEETLAAMAEGGLTQPVSIKSVNTIVTSAETGGLTADSLIPVRIAYEKSHMYMEMLSEVIDQDSPLAKMAIIGKYDLDGKFSVDSIINYPYPEADKEALLQAMEKLQQGIEFPEAPIGIGESFSQKLPIKVPLAGVDPFEMLIDVTYTLKELDGEIAKLEIKQQLEMNADNGQFRISATGSGNGTSSYDIRNQQLINYETDLDMKIKMDMGEIVLRFDMSTLTSQTITIK